MKGQVTRFLNHKGKAYDLADNNMKSKHYKEDDVGFFDLWRHATRRERACAGAGAAAAWLCSLGLVVAVTAYGELTSLFVQRHQATPTTPHARLLRLFGGGARLAGGDRDAHMDALVADALAFGAVSVAVMCAQLACAAAAVALATSAADRMVTRLRLHLLRTIISQEIAFFDTNTTTDFTSALTEDMEKLRLGVGEHVVMTSYLAGTVVCGCALALGYGWQLTLAAMAVVPVAVLVQALVSKYQTQHSERETAAYNKAGRIAEEVLSAIRTVRAYAGEELEAQRYGAALAGAGAAARRRGVWAGAGAGLGWLLTYSLNAVVFAYGAELVVRDRAAPAEQQEYHPGVMVTVLFCTFLSAQNITMCSPHLEVFSRARGAARALFRLLERQSGIDALAEGGLRPDAFRGDIVFDNVHFNYPSRPDVKVLRGLSLSVAAGETVALVGGSGAGKSTVLQLLQRMYEPSAGSVRVDNQRLRDLNLHHYRTSIGVVGQEPVLFSGTIRENITLGLGDVPEERLVAATKTANAHHFITKLANGYETVVGAGGASLSGGQKQRVAIARAVLRAPRVLLLDEPTSALDPAAERRMQAALDAARAGRTTLVVSHRLATVRHATRIVYLQDGAVLEQGSHAELLARRGAYWALLQRDITHRSIASALSQSEPEEDEPEEDERVEEPPERFRRSSGRRSATFGSPAAAAWRSSARVPCVAADGLCGGADTPPQTQAEAEADAGRARVSVRALARLHRGEWALLAGGGLASFTIGATMPAFAYLFSKLYGMFALADDAAVLAAARQYAAMFLGAAALCGLVTFLQTWLFNLAGARLTDRLRRLTFQNFLYQEQAWFDEPANSTGALCARLAADCAAVQGATGTCLGTVLQGISTMVLGVGLAMFYSWKMTLVSLLSVPCVIGGIYLEGWVARRAAAAERRALEDAARVAGEAVRHVRTVQALGVERTLLERYSRALAEGARGAGRARAVRGPVYGLCLCAPTLGYAVSLAYGGYLIARDDLPYEHAILVSEALIYGAWMLAEALSFTPSFGAARRSAGRILGALARRPAVVTEPSAREDPDWSCSGEVQFRDVQFRYPTRPAAPVLRGVSLTLAAGRTLALVGPSGCGKSTLMHLLLRNYDAQEGTVCVDGRDARRSLTLRQLRASLGVVSQEPALFARSLRDNIAYGAAGHRADTAAVVRAAQQADVHAFIAALPQGYDTPVDGAALSGGQKQRVAIARALIRQPRILLLDEATSALDAASEKTVQATLEAASRGRSTIVIAHRLATVRRADTIAVIDRGEVRECGSHDELVARRGLYWDLLLQQQPPEPASAEPHPAL